MVVNIKKLKEGVEIPKYAKEGDAGMDLVAHSKDVDKYGNYSYGTGLAMEIPKGYMGLLFPRSSVSKTSLSLRNSVGVIDSGYRGEIIFKYGKVNDNKVYELGERVGQIIIMPYPTIEFNEVDELEDSDRSKGGFGSTGV